MKKLILVSIIMIVIGYFVYKNGPLLFLKILAAGSNSSQSTPISASGPNPPYKNGTFTGVAADAFYGNIQVAAVISGGKIVDVQFKQYPNDRTRSIAINTIAMPNLSQEAIQAQNAQVDVVSGATDSSNAFVQSLQSALSQAK